MNHDDRIVAHYPDYGASRAKSRERAKQQVIDDLEREIRYLRYYGNKDCVAMADAAMILNAMEKS